MLKKIFSYSGKYKKNAYMAVLFILCSVFSEVGAFYMVYRIIQGMIDKSSFEEIVPWAIGVLAAYALKSLFFSVGLDQSHIFAYNTLCNIRRKLAAKLKNVSLGAVMEKGAGSYRQNFVDDIESIELLLAHGLPEGLPYAVSCISVYIVIFIVDWRMGLLSLVTLPIGFAAMCGMAVSGVKKSEKYRESLINLNKSIIEYVAGMEVVKIFNKTRQSGKKITNAITEYRDFTADWYKSNFDYMAVFQSVTPSTIAAMLPVGMYMVHKGTIELPVLLFCIMLALSISMPLLKIMNFFPLIYNVVTKLEILEKQFEQPEIKTGNKDFEVKSSDIEFCNVSFAYEDATVLDDISFKIEKNQKIGVVGESGSGKSTIGKLLMHYWDVNNGCIKIGGVDIRDISLPKLMERISYVSQENFLFNTSIRENLLIAKPDATQEEIENACKAACCHDVIIGLEKGYDTNAGDSGNKLSGGERQRITIARAILKNADIVILDEATSFTDAKNDALINKAIRNLAKDKTLITIAHKLSNVKDMDKIMLIDKGKLVACAPHEQLLEQPIYKSLWERYVKTIGYKFQVKEAE